ncbi:MAG TPA: hypothetical protein DCZ04_11375, partial [Syntrophorhabdus aromaticivorans]|nr:hypothetical protein [Syntrophorhabdus aromaticivorans]
HINVDIACEIFSPALREQPMVREARGILAPRTIHIEPNNQGFPDCYNPSMQFRIVPECLIETGGTDVVTVV